MFFAYIKFCRYMNQCIEKRGETEEEEEKEDEEEEKPAFRKYFQIKRKFFKGEFEVSFQPMFQLLKSFIDKLVHDHPELCLKLYLELTHITNECDHNKDLDEETYDVVTQSLELYQNEIADAESKIFNIALITGSLQTINCMSEDNIDSLASNTASYSSKLLKKFDQCLAVLNSTHLFFGPGQRSEQRVMECFKKALKITDANFNSHPDAKNFHLYIAILNKFIYYLSQEDFTSIKTDDVNKCIEIIKTKLEKVPDQKENHYLVNTFNYINAKKGEDSKFEGLSI